MTEETAAAERYDFTVYAEGIVYASVCSSLPLKETLERLRRKHSSAVEPWVLADERFRSGEENPGPCDKYPPTHRHYLFERRRTNELLRGLVQKAGEKTK